MKLRLVYDANRLEGLSPFMQEIWELAQETAKHGLKRPTPERMRLFREMTKRFENGEIRKREIG